MKLDFDSVAWNPSFSSNEVARAMALQAEAEMEKAKAMHSLAQSLETLIKLWVAENEAKPK